MNSATLVVTFTFTFTFPLPHAVQPQNMPRSKRLSQFSAAPFPIGNVAAFVCCVLLLATCSSCGGQKHHGTNDLHAQLAALPSVYMSESGKRIETGSPPADQLGHVRNGEIYWRAMTCNNPKCPHAGESSPFLFVTPDPRVELVNGEITELHFADPQEWAAYIQEHNLIWPPVCPACLERFQLEQADAAKLAEYQAFVAAYELPEVEKRREEINQLLHEKREEYRRRTGG